MHMSYLYEVQGQPNQSILKEITIVVASGEHRKGLRRDIKTLQSSEYTPHLDWDVFCTGVLICQDSSTACFMCGDFAVFTLKFHKVFLRKI